MTTSWMQTVALLEMSLTSSVLIMWVVQKFSQKVLSLPVKMVLLALLVNLFFWPLGVPMELPLAAYIRGITGDLSILSLLLLWSTILPLNRSTPSFAKVVIVLSALSFYPLALGLGMVDPYAWGYGSLAMLVTVVLIAIVCGLANWTKGVWLIGFALIAWSVGWHESTNLWDYLIDPFLVIWALASLFAAILQKRRMKARSGYLFRAG